MPSFRTFRIFSYEGTYEILQGHLVHETPAEILDTYLAVFPSSISRPPSEFREKTHFQVGGGARARARAYVVREAPRTKITEVSKRARLVPNSAYGAAYVS